jgi:hypothetical protein
MKEIPLTQGFTAIVDDEDYDLVASVKWCAMRSATGVYAIRQVVVAKNKQSAILMHRLILQQMMEVLPRARVDHKNGIGIDNRRENLRLATHSQNMANRRKSQMARPARICSQYKGVAYYRGKWQAFVGGEYLGRFTSEEEAARVYDAAARIKWGEFARLNFPEEPALCGHIS